PRGSTLLGPPPERAPSLRTSSVLRSNGRNRHALLAAVGVRTGSSGRHRHQAGQGARSRDAPLWSGLQRWAFGRAAPGGTGTRRARALAAGTPLSGGRTLGPSPFIAFDASSPRGRLPAGLEVDPSEVDPL